MKYLNGSALVKRVFFLHHWCINLGKAAVEYEKSKAGERVTQTPNRTWGFMQLQLYWFALVPAIRRHIARTSH